MNLQIHKTDNPKITHLCEADGEALDAILAARATDSAFVAATADQTGRVAKAEALLGILDQDPVDAPPADLTRRTLAKVRENQQRQRFAQQVQMLAEPRQTIGVGWRQLVAAASIFLIAASLLIPVLDRNRSEAQRVVGAARLGSTGIAIQKYGQDHDQLLPQREHGDVWLNIGQPVQNEDQPVNSNSAHLYVLVRARYIDPENLDSPANPHAPAPGEMTAQDHDWHSPEQVSYSYQNQFGHYMIRLDENASLPVLANRNPIFVVRDGKIAFDPTVSQNAPSRMHKGMGQNVLLLDGRVLWTVRPEVNGDNIWVAKGHSVYDGDETPADPGDSHLVP